MNRLFLFFLLMYSTILEAQQAAPVKYVNAEELTVVGRAAGVGAGKFQRVADSFLPQLPKRVAELSKNSAGIYIAFQTNSKRIQVQWVLEKYISLWNMTPLAINGLDMYGLKDDKFQYVSSARPLSDTNSVVLIEGLSGDMNQYKLYLPLYASIKSIRIGVDSTAVIEKVGTQNLPQKKVVIYGSSITQGASASRPGMAYPSILSRRFNIETFNLGFSGSGKMEIAMADVLASMDADVYILDCVPNPTPAEIRERALPFIKRLRQLKPFVPVIMIESVIREQANWSSRRHDIVFSQNEEFRKAYEQLKKENFRDLYYITAANLIGDDHDATIDGTHVTDLGFTRMADEIGKTLKPLIFESSTRKN